MPQLVPPHNSEQIKPLLLPETERAEERKRAEKLSKIPLDSRAVSDVFMLAMGAYTPLDGFMGHDDWRGSCLDMKLTSGVFWPIPITLPVDRSPCRQHPCRRRGHAHRRGVRRNTRRHGGSREIFNRQATGGRARLSHRRSEASGRRQGTWSGECQLGRARHGAERRRISCQNTRTFISVLPSRGPCFSSGAGRMSLPSKPAIPCTAATSTW